MQVDIKKFLEEADIKESLYPGKRIIKPCKQIGEYKNHCVVVDWRNPETIIINIKPGLSGKHLAPEIAKEYPVCLQMPTQVTIDIINDNDNKKKDEKEDEDGKSKGKSSSGSGGKKPAKKKLKDVEIIAARFGDSAEGALNAIGEIKDMVVMGVQLAKESFASAFSELTRQIQHAKITTTEVLAKAANMVTRVQPPGFMKPKGDETAQYNYDRDKNANIGFKMSLV